VVIQTSLPTENTLFVQTLLQNCFLQQSFLDMLPPLLPKGKTGMPYRMLWNDVEREGAKPGPELVSGLFCYVPLHNNRYGIENGGECREATLSRLLL
jgi:hypothetical protein